jgi:YbgC/YbaW family acyl-CoA thioester hydrolase
MASVYRVSHRVDFADTDMAGIMHFANFFRFMERTEHAFLRSLGTSVHARHDGATYGWPRVHVECDYKRPLRFEDEFEVELRVREKREKSLVYDFIFRKEQNGTGEEVARGSFTTVCVSLDAATGEMKAVPIPAWLSERIEPAER